MPLPSFVIIGAMKSGTTTLHHRLNMHPSIGMSKRKEINFFNKFYHRGENWYESLFVGDHKLFGEASPRYTMAQEFPKTAANMHATLPEAKLIYIVRDPIERIISHLHHNLYRDRLKPSEVEREVLTNPDYIKTSSYYFQVSQYLKYYPRDKFLFLPFELLKKDPDAALHQIYNFLGVKPYNISLEDKIYNDSSKKYLIKNYDAIHKLFPDFLIKPYKIFYYFLGIKRDRPLLNEETIQALRERLREDITAFKQLTGNSFSEWKMFNQSGQQEPVKHV